MARGVSMTLLAVMTAMLGAILTRNAVRAESAKQDHSYWKTDSAPQMTSLTGFDIPMLKLLKRQVRNFHHGGTASVTLVFRASQPTTVRWFVHHPKWRPANSEVPNLLPVEGDPIFKVSFISSADVTATTLVIPHFKERLPRDFETIFTLEDGTMQYQLRTLVARGGTSDVEDIDSPEWMVIPPPKWQFPSEQMLMVHCKVFIPKERVSSTNELVMYRDEPRLIKQADGKHVTPRIEYHQLFDSNKHKRINSEEDKSKSLIMQSDRKSWTFRDNLYAIYEVKITTQNTSSEYEGVYQCALERENHDKQYVISSMSLVANPSPFTRKPHADVISCEKSNFDKEGGILTLTEGHTTCIRCRGFGYPRPKVGLYRVGLQRNDEKEIRETSTIRVNKYINVADAGIPEATYIFRLPTASLAGEYACKARNDGFNPSNVNFRVYFKGKIKHSPTG